MKPPENQPAPEKPKVLIVDDRKENLVALRQVLAEVDADIVEAAGGNEALAATLSREFAMAILDVWMPGMDGYELAGLLRGDVRTRDLPIIFITASHSEEKHVFKGYEAGAVDYILKPYNPEVLLAKVRVFLELDRNRKELRRSRDKMEALVTERTADLNRSLEDVRLAASQWQTTFDAMIEGVALLDADRKVLRCNEAFRALAGKPENEIIGQLCCRLMHGSDEPEPECPASRTSQTRKRETWRTVIGGRWFDIAADPVLDATGRLAGFAHVMADITEQKRAEEELRESEARARAMFEANPDMMFLVDRDYTFLDYRAPASDDLLMPPEDFIGKKISEVFDPDSAQMHMDMAKQASETGELQVYDYQVTLKGKTRIFEARMVRSGRENVLAVVREVTEHRRLLEQFHQAMKMEAIGRLAGGVAHDFNNALTPIMVISEILLKQFHPSDPIHEDLQEIKDAGERCANLTRQLLAFGRRQPLQMSVFCLNEVVSNIERMLSRVIGEDIGLVKFLDPDLGNVKADVGQIEQIIVNLAVNARDAMPRGGKLTIETRNVSLDEEYANGHVSVESGPYVMLAVSDTGTGMDEQTREHIFEPFFTTKEKGKGTGLGLSTVYGIVKQCGGNVWCYSEPGRGTAFKIYLPRVEEEAEVLARPRTAPGRRTGSETVLLVEDEANVRRAARRILETRGYRVMEAESGERALEIFQAAGDAIHIIITDIVMPGMSGKDLAERARALRPATRVLYISGYTDNAIVHHGVLDPGTHFIQKPFSADALSAKVREVLD